ncbi:DUF1697 domain-containing protein [Streptococcus mutans]|uniref:DUF1697 domain-containing protein n=1 Tax=Streptococcus mutans TaxID=1309 RepID=UPI001ED98D2B|nr:DUF1697 domain-containing protein [Streptococcus mutans]
MEEIEFPKWLILGGFWSLQSVQTYIQSGNIICETDWSAEKLNQLIHDTIKIKPNWCRLLRSNLL